MKGITSTCAVAKLPIIARRIFYTAGVSLLLSCGGGGNGSTPSPGTTEASFADGVQSGDNGSSGSTDLPPVGGLSDPAQFTGDSPLNNPPFDSDGYGFYTTHTASARLSGPVMGSGDFNDEQQVRSIPFQVGRSDDGLEIERVYAGRSEAPRFTKYTSLMLIVRNTASQVLCFVKADGITVIDVDNQPHAEDIVDFAFVAGTAYFNNSLSSTYDSCIPPNERAFIATPFKIALDRVKGLNIVKLTGRGSDNYAPLPDSVVPTQYELDFDGDLLRITLQNQSSRRINVTGGHHIILNAAGIPMFQRFSTMLRGVDEIPDGLFEPGEERTESVVIAGFRGQASTVRSVFSIEPAD